MSVEFLKAIPQLPVTDLEKSVAYYRDALGFRVTWYFDESFVCIENGAAVLFLYAAEEAAGGDVVSLPVADAESALGVFRQSGAEVMGDLEFMPWGTREFQVRDPDGHLFRIVEQVDAPEAARGYHFAAS